MHHAAFLGVVVCHAVILVCDFLGRTVSGGGNRRPPFATADNFDTAMINRYRRLLLSWQGKMNMEKKDKAVFALSFFSMCAVGVWGQRQAAPIRAEKGESLSRSARRYEVAQAAVYRPQVATPLVPCR